MGCAIADNQEQQQQLHHQTTVVDRNNTDISAGCPRRVIAMETQPMIHLKVSQLKESHSALVKILESAPLNKATKPQSHHQRLPQAQTTPPHQQQQATHHNHITQVITKQEPQLRPESGSESMSPPPAINIGDALNRPPNHHYYRKRAKHLTICDTASSSGDDDENPRKHSATESPAADVICPWKKTRIAREWRQKRESTDASESAAEQMVCDEDDDDADGGVEADCCDCQKDKNTFGWRRASSESSSGCDDGHQSPSPPNTTPRSSHGSECGDSDGQHGNISELCKKFNENLSEKDVSFVVI